MAQSHTWSIRGRRDSLLNWDAMTDKNPTSNVMRPSTTSPAMKLSTEIVRPEDQCAWCGQNEIGEGGVRGGQLIDGLYHASSSSPNGGVQVFCSDVCFSQCRRAALKRAKVCDWCKHVRHTVSYVDLNDGRRQLQFCTDKCRNQYKMQLFCAEASSLGVQPASTANNTCSSTAPSASTASSEGSTPPTSSSIDPPTVKNNSHSQPFSTGAELLITPELWMTDCHLKENDFAGMASLKKENDVHDDMNAVQFTLSSSNSDVEEQDGAEDTPLNLIHSSRRNSYTTTSTIKRKASQVDEEVISKSVSLQSVSKKGKSHRKTSISYFPSSGSLPLPPPPPPPLLSFPTTNQPDGPTGWPGIPYPHLAHPSFLLQSQLLSLNHSLAKRSNLLPQTPIVPAPHQFQPEVVTEIPVASTSGNMVPKVTLIENSSGQEKGTKQEDESNALNDSFKRFIHPTIPPNYVVLRVPILVPLPIPVPIPIPLNVHEKYLKQLLA